MLDSRIRKMWNPKTGGGTISNTIALHSYVVAVQAPNGETVKLEVEQRIETIDDKDDPRINVVAVCEANTAAEKERFGAELDS